MKITHAEISRMPLTFMDPMPQVTVSFEDGTTKTLFSYYPDEISFTASEFVGLTESEAHDLKHKKDVAYLRS
jgi:hypothetical protein